jgi:hypothetical protein
MSIEAHKIIIAHTMYGIGVTSHQLTHALKNKKFRGTLSNAARGKTPITPGWGGYSTNAKKRQQLPLQILSLCCHGRTLDVRPESYVLSRTSCSDHRTSLDVQ